MDDVTVKLGLLMETAQSQQRLAEGSLERLQAELQRLDDSIRDEVRRVLQGELLSLASESQRTIAELSAARRAVHMRTALWSVFVTLACGAVTLAVAAWFLPSRTEVESLRARRDALQRTVADLERRGARLDLRPCGDSGRLCVRVDREAPAYGANGEYRVVMSAAAR